MKPIQAVSQRIFSGSRMGSWVLLLLFVAVVTPLTFFIRPIGDSESPAEEAVLQEQIGYMILALNRFDQDRTESLKQRWNQVREQIKEFERGKTGRLQETLGQAIAQTGRNMISERGSLRQSIMAAEQELRMHHQTKSARWQEQLGKAIQVSARRTSAGGQDFQAAFQREVARLRKVEERTSRRLAAQLQTLKEQEAQFLNRIPLMYFEAIDSAKRSARVFEASEAAWIRRVMDEIKQDLAWKRQPEDYVQMAGWAREILKGPQVVNGFVEYGLPALVGLVLVALWVAFITRKDNIAWTVPQSVVSELSPGISYVWKKGVSEMSQSTTIFSWPKEVIFGNNASDEVGKFAAQDNVQQAMVLTDEGINKAGILNPLKASFNKAGIECKVYDGVKGEVPDYVINDVFDQCKQTKTNLLVAVGGGSVIDTAKATGILLTNGGKIQDYEGMDKVHWPIPHLYVVPTTAGCGSEASQFCVVLDTKRKRKIEIFSRRIIPQRIFIDPLLTLTKPAELTASCGMDALANCIEAYFSTWSSPLTDALALHAIRLISGWLRAAVANGKNLEARTQLTLAAFEAGLAFTNAHCGAVHALGHPIAGMFNVPQRLGDAILLPHVMRYNMNADMDRMVDVAVAMGEPIGGLSKREAAEKAISSVQYLLVDIGLPTTLEKVGVEKEAISELTQQAAQDAFLRTNPRILDAKDIERIYENAFVEYAELAYGPAGRRELFH